MSNVAKLKKQAAELEAKKQFDKALAVYVKLLESFDAHAEEIDVSLFNRVGDLMLRQGNVADAVDYYEQAVDHYAETKLFNNAIALCNKILRHSPGRASIYYKLGKIAATKGFKNDAKINFLEYADRMQQAGKVDEAFRALKEFADLSPDQDEIRQMLADQLLRIGRKDEAIEQLQLLHERYDAEGRVSEAAATATRMRSIDPSVEPRTGGARRQTNRSSLVFLDLDAPPVRPSGQIPAQPTPSLARSAAAPVPKPAPAPPEAPPEPAPLIVEYQAPSLPTEPEEADADLDVVFEDEEPTSLAEAAELAELDDEVIGADGGGDEQSLHPSLANMTPVSPQAVAPPRLDSELLAGLESTHMSDEVDALELPPPETLLDFEPTALGTTAISPVDRSSAPTHATHEDLDVIEDLPVEVPPPRDSTTRPAGKTPTIDFELTDLPAPKARPVKPHAATPLDGMAIIGDDAPISETLKPRQPGKAVSGGRPSLPDLDVVAAAAETFDVVEEEEEPAVNPTLRPLGKPAPDMPIELAASETLDQDAATAEELSTGDYEPIVVPTPSIARRSTAVAAHTVELLRADVDTNPNNWALRRRLAEAMLEAGDRPGGLSQLDAAMNGAEHGGDLDFASSLAEEIARLEPEVVKHHQKRVEFAFRTNDRPRLIEAYVALADALLRSDQGDKSRIIYQRVLDLAPDEPRAHAALDTIVAADEPSPPPALRTSAASKGGTERPAPSNGAMLDTPARDFVNLGDWLRDDTITRDTRMVVAEQEPTGDEQADFADMLRKFKQGVAENVDPEDYQSHYDLAIAYKEMGLLDEAIAEFQKALGGTTNRLPTFEALGQCFIEQGQFKLASSVLARALNERASEDQLVGVLYLLGRAAEAQGRADEALGYYQRVFLLDIQFRDIAERMREVERAAR